MRDSERTVLEAWADGNAGASARLARRAWAVLEHASRTDPHKLAEAAGTAAGVARWVTAFHAMGLPGLLDAPRAGRPATSLRRALQRMEALPQLGRLTPAQRAASLDRAEREAVWRLHRHTGETLVRRHRHLDLPLAAPHGFEDLAGVFVVDGLCVIATLPGADDHASARAGTWLGVDAQLSQHPPVGAGLPTILSALAAVGAARPESAARNGSVDPSLLRRFAGGLSDLARRHPSRLHVHALIDLETPELWLRYLALCRQYAMWTPQAERHPSALARQDLVPHRRNLDAALLPLLQAALVQTPAAARSRLAKALSDAAGFAWIRSRQLRQPPEDDEYDQDLCDAEGHPDESDAD